VNQSSLPAAAARGAPLRRLLLAGHSDFWRLWVVGFVVYVVRGLETIVVGIVTYQRTASPFLVAIMTMLRLLPMGLFGAFIGAWVERIERRTALIGVIAAMGATSFSMAILAHAGHLQIWHLALASFINGVGWATDNPVRRVMMGEVVGSGQMGTAMSLDVGTNNASRIIGPTLGGLLLMGAGIDGAFSLSVVLYAAALLALIGLHYRNTSLPRTGSAVMARIMEGFAWVRSDPKLSGTLLITIIYNIFGWPYTSMVPVIGHDQLGLDPGGVGLLASMDGTGAFLGALLLAMFLRPAWYGRTYLAGVVIYLLMMIVFGLVPEAAVAGGALVCLGLGGAGFSVMQATLVYLAAPPDLRSRLLGVLSLCIGIGPLGFIGLGLLADVIGANWATAASGAAGLLVLAATRPWWRAI
jgi:MFS family permease